ncbi:MAG TPA: hypothetical protein PKA53_01635 [Sphingobacterium sp.]|nr:hypothetical protein [Sphingobacterium sp.]
MNNTSVTSIIVALRVAITLYRKENIYLGRNAIEVLLYASSKETITATEIAGKLLYCNINQAKRTLGTLVKNHLLWSLGEGVKGQPLHYVISDQGAKEVEDFIRLFERHS